MLNQSVLDSHRQSINAITRPCSCVHVEHLLEAGGPGGVGGGRTHAGGSQQQNGPVDATWPADHLNQDVQQHTGNTYMITKQLIEVLSSSRKSAQESVPLGVMTGASVAGRSPRGCVKLKVAESHRPVECVPRQSMSRFCLLRRRIICMFIGLVVKSRYRQKPMLAVRLEPLRPGASMQLDPSGLTTVPQNLESCETALQKQD